MSPARLGSAALCCLSALLHAGLAQAGTTIVPPPAPPAKVAPAPPPAASTHPPPPAPAPPEAPIAAPLPTAIAQPGPDASVEKVAEAKDVAQAAALTPIVASPTDATKPAFQLYTQVDLPILGVGLVFAGARLFRTQKAYCAPRCNPSELNGLDKVTAGYWSPLWSTGSDIGLYGIMAGAATVLMVDEGFFPALNDGLVILESGLTATAVSSIVTLSAGRPRPFLYGDKAPLGDRNSADAGLSFVSNHVAVGCAVVTSTFMAMRRLEPRSKVPYVILGVGGATAGFIAVGRIMAGKHFITDTLMGAVIGTSMGVIVPAMHDSPVKIVPVVSDTQRGLGLSGVF
jgi:membrane-associated phospholipid phosphatase